MTKALTVASLNALFSQQQDVFEFAQERDDWKFPRYVKNHKKRVDEPDENLETMVDEDDG